MRINFLGSGRCGAHHKKMSCFVEPSQTWVPIIAVEETPPEIHRVRRWIDEQKTRQGSCHINGEIKIEDAVLEEIQGAVLKSNEIYQGEKKRSTIYRVPTEIYSFHEEDYKPKAVCIGPFFYESRCQQHLKSMQNYKWVCVYKLMSKHDDHDQGNLMLNTLLLQKCLTKMKELEVCVRSSYSEAFPSLTSKAFTLMLMLDGCFLLRLLQRHAAEKTEVDDDDARQVVGRLWIWNLVRKKEQPKFYIPVKDVHHLLHLIYLSVLPCPQDCKPTPQPQSPQWIPSATELREAGIKFKKRENARGFLSFLDVKFYDGVMEIPQIKVHDYSVSLFRNLIAFEQCYADTECHITVYAAFMNFLINTEKDTRLLHLNGILINSLTVDKDAKHFFSRLCNEVHYAQDTNYLRKLFRDVNEYHGSKCNQWRAYFVRNYFSNPWSFIALLAAAYGLLLATIQAIHAFFR
ncbi:UPF0481 protein At3g47200-like isoform X1 [Phoenix dactylifera]|uniref:UPF0481 protein At3g47200-like isoform X1 n=1 Tax=Phoenix dactylifera TaxID=42345 RepID=A0A8B9AGG4_PHODC|nr:UPF0481 protein At3g47200-like isoform X1 [Phoenix dactylifera]